MRKSRCWRSLLSRGARPAQPALPLDRRARLSRCGGQPFIGAIKFDERRVPIDWRRVVGGAAGSGGAGRLPLESRDYGQGFVHVFGADTLLVVLRELDTITDLVGYLDAREELLKPGLRGAIIATEHDLLAVYLMNTHSFKPLVESAHDLTILADVWDDFVASPQYAARSEANGASYIWDGLIACSARSSNFSTTIRNFAGSENC